MCLKHLVILLIGYVLSKGALKKVVVEGIQNKSCEGKDENYGDIAMGKCMEKLGVSPVDTRDSQGRGRFLPLAPEQLLIPGALKPDHWYWSALFYPATVGFNCCSDLAISFDGISHKRMRSLDYLIYHLRPYGISTKVNLNHTIANSVIK